ncbi:hypothetical protein [Streptomyces sp. NBC_00316]|uniref:hypothetical protein n=1 Tax=Streptomyces sp. NBC_00316 TaxID=2975710 RepID=UPI002E29525C|nr:hypothetical protein [Streptomyces sp. NBC_00316]
MVCVLPESMNRVSMNGPPVNGLPVNRLRCASGAALGAAPDKDVRGAARAVAPSQARPGHALWAVVRR